MHGMMRLLVAAALAAGWGTPVLADPPAAPARANSDVDESGLRFYAQQNDRGRVEAEMRRLKTLYPEWTAPEDLWTPAVGAGPDEGPLWDLFASDRMEELRLAIDARREAEPGWEPSRDLALKMRQKTARMKVMTLSGDKQWKKLAELARTEPSIAEIGDVDILWLLAEGYSRAKQLNDALNLYKSILTTSADPRERMGTIQKAMATLPMRDVETLIALGRTAENKSEFAPIQIDISRMRVSAYLHDERSDEIPVEEMRLVEQEAKSARDPDQPGLVAWYRYKRREFAEALDWFKLALTRGGDAMIAHGLAHSLRELGMYREAEEVAHAWRAGHTNNRILYIDVLEADLTKPVPPYIEPERLARYGRAVVEEASGEGAQALAWYAYNSCQFDVALEWFERAVAWMPKQDTVYGYALALRRAKRDRELVELVNRYDGLFPKVMALLFPHDFLEPPTACETASWDQARWWDLAQQQAPSAFAPKRAASPSAVAQRGQGPHTAGVEGYVPGALHDPLMRHSWGLVTGPTGRISPQWRPASASFQPPSLQKINRWPARDMFPVPVRPENPLRFLAQGSVIPAVPTPLAFAREPVQAVPPHVARRVPGVEPMPYEKYGVTLLSNPEPGAPTPGAPPAARPQALAPSFGVSYETTSSIASAHALPADPLGVAARIAQERMSADAARASGVRVAGPGGAVPPLAANGPGAGYPVPGTPLNAPAFSGASGSQALSAGPYASLPASPWPPQAYPAPPSPVGAQPYPQSWTSPAPVAVERAPAPRRETSPRKAERHVRPGACSASLGAGGAARDMSPSQAVATGWCLLNAKRPAEAAIAFDRGLAGQGRVAEDAAYGKSLALLQSNGPRAAAAAAQQAPISAERRADIGVMALEQRIFSSYNKGDYLGVLRLLEQRAPHAAETRDLTLMRGWALYQLGRLDEAERLFGALDRQMSTKESRSGLAAIDSQRLGKLQ